MKIRTDKSNEPILLCRVIDAHLCKKVRNVSESYAEYSRFTLKPMSKKPIWKFLYLVHHSVHCWIPLMVFQLKVASQPKKLYYICTTDRQGLAMLY
jgi:hypothetical protein